MSIPFSGTFTKTGGLSSAIAKQLRGLTLKPVKKAVFKFDPFHKDVEQTRYFLYHITTPKILKTNLKCIIKTEVICDRADPTVTFNLENGEIIEFRSAFLSALEMLQYYNKHITVLSQEEEVSEVVLTKASKPGKRIKSKK